MVYKDSSWSAAGPSVDLSLLAVLAGSIVPATDFGIRPVASAFPPPVERAILVEAKPGGASFTLGPVASFVAQFGRVTSLRRTPEHNWRVGGATNSWHLHGRAVDVVRSPGVSHARLSAALRGRGCRLIESLDEGDDSHFAFGNGLAVARPRSGAEQLAEIKHEVDYFRFVEVPAGRRTSRKSALR